MDKFKSLLRYLCQIKYWFKKKLRMNMEVTRGIKNLTLYIYYWCRFISVRHDTCSSLGLV